MDKAVSQGTCGFCNATFDKSAMSKHLASCKQRNVESETLPAKRKPQKTKILHLVVEGRYSPEYWMHLSAPANATLEDLDRFLRNIWLECCGHLSAFIIGGTTYSRSPMGEHEGKNMYVALRKVLVARMKFYYEYDFGTSTDLTLKVVSEREGGTKGESIQLLARNEATSIKCMECGEAASQVCSQCVYSGEGWLCDKCADKHACGEEMFLPVVNSPRVGMCAYTG